MTDDESRAGQYGGPYGGPANPWAFPGAPGGGSSGGAPFGAAPDYPAPQKSRTLIWISAIVVVGLLAASGVGAFILDTRHHSGPSAAVAAPPASSAPPTSTGSSTPHPSASPQSTAPSSLPPSPRPAGPSTGQPTTPAGGTAPGSASGPLDQYLLAPAEVGASSMMFLIDGGRNATNQATLDWCNFTYTSEAMRMTRVQVEYTGERHTTRGQRVRALPEGRNGTSVGRGSTSGRDSARRRRQPMATSTTSSSAHRPIASLSRDRSS